MKKFLILCLFFTGCGGGTDFIPIDPNKPPPVTPPDPQCTPAPKSEPGADQMLVLGLGLPKSVQIGTPARADNTYHWYPGDSLDASDKAQVIASPKHTQTYTLIVHNACGDDSAKVVVHVYAEDKNYEEVTE